jgi:hypothetical protein
MKETNTKQAIIDECWRQYDNCLYTAMSFHGYLKSRRMWRTVLTLAPILLGALLAPGVMCTHMQMPIVIVLSSMPALFNALRINENIDEISRVASTFTRLRDEFRQTAEIHASQYDDARLTAHFDQLVARMAAARSYAITAPERFYKQACKKIKGMSPVTAAELKRKNM